MPNDLLKFLNFLKISNLEPFKESNVVKVKVIKKENKIDINLNNHYPYQYEVLHDLFKHLKKASNEDMSFSINFTYDEVRDEDVLNFTKDYLKNLKIRKPSLSGISDDIKIDEDVITFEVGSNLEEQKIKKESKNIQKELMVFGYGEYEITTFLNQEIINNVKNEIEEAKKNTNYEVKEQKIEGNILLGKEIKEEISIINNVVGESKNVAFEAYVFGMDYLERDNINIITVKISDKTNSMLAKIFIKDKNEYQLIKKEIKENKWYRFLGNIEYDTFARDYVLKVRSLEKIDSKDNSVVDDAEKPRVELHLHTMMSAMDGVTPYEQKDPNNVVKYALNMGWKALAITDHNCVQSFPEIFHTVRDINKGKEESEHFKVLYGAEMNIVNDDVDIVFNNRTYNLLEDTFVVFDTETTGFYAGSDTLIDLMN